MLTVKNVAADGLAAKYAIRPGDQIVAINHRPVTDIFDFHFHSDAATVRLVIRRGGVDRTVVIRDGAAAFLGLDFEPFRYKRCNNRCIFCFVDQLPPGVRKSLRFKDEDYRLSFLYGNYITCTNLRAEERDRIIKLRLTPLYISVHATAETVRRRMLGNPRVPPILDSIKQFARGRITMHLQIVLCPGINDGAVLDRTLDDLAAYYPYAASVALIPVGLTRHRSGQYPLPPVNAAMARTIIAQGQVWQQLFKKKLGTRFVFLADEFYLKAGLALPGRSHYEHFAQVENGVGMGRQLLDSLRRGQKQAARRRPAGTLAIVTGLSAYPLVQQGLRPYRAFLKYKVYPVRNDFLGPGVTVAGLLAGRDIVRQLQGKDLGDRVVLPPNCLNDEGFFIDDMTIDEVARKLRVPVVQLHGNSIRQLF